MAHAKFDEEGRKLCFRCGEFKSSDEYPKAGHTKCGMASYCKPCRSQYEMERKKRKPNEERLANQRRWQKRYRDGITEPLAPSTKTYQQPPHVADRERWRAFFGGTSKYRYNKKQLALLGLTCDDYIAMWTAQNACCAICSKPEDRCHSKTGTRWMLSIDHDHTTSTARGLLCARCNNAIGLFFDDPGVLRKAAEYVERYRRG